MVDVYVSQPRIIIQPGCGILGVPLTKDPDDFAQISFNEVGGNPGSPRIQVYWQYTRRLMGGSIYLKLIRLPWHFSSDYKP